MAIDLSANSIYREWWPRLSGGWRAARAAGRGKAPTLEDVARRADDRLLRDIGLTRAEVLGVEGTFSAELECARRIWSL